MSEDTNKFDVGGQQVAAVYAKAFLGAVGAEGDLVSLVDELEAVVSEGVLKQSGFQELLENELVAPVDKVGILDRVFAGHVTPLVLNFLKVVAEHERLMYLGEIAAQVRELHDESLQRRRVHVTTAAPMDASTEQGLAEKIGKQLGCEPILVTSVDSSLIGGVVIRIGDRVYDASVSDRIRHIRQDLATRYSEAIETRREELVGEFTEG